MFGLDFNQRKHIHQFDHPLIDYWEYGGAYNPLLYPIMFIDIVTILFSFAWHRYQSLKAERGYIHSNMRIVISNERRRMNNDDLPPAERDEAKRNVEYIMSILAEMNIQSDYIERVKEQEEEINTERFS